jgi:hypothetical protein
MLTIKLASFNPSGADGFEVTSGKKGTLLPYKHKRNRSSYFRNYSVECRFMKQWQRFLFISVYEIR